MRLWRQRGIADPTPEQMTNNMVLLSSVPGATEETNQQEIRKSKAFGMLTWFGRLFSMNSSGCIFTNRGGAEMHRRGGTLVLTKLVGENFFGENHHSSKKKYCKKCHIGNPKTNPGVFLHLTPVRLHLCCLLFLPSSHPLAWSGLCTVPLWLNAGLDLGGSRLQQQAVAERH